MFLKRQYFPVKQNYAQIDLLQKGPVLEMNEFNMEDPLAEKY